MQVKSVPMIKAESETARILLRHLGSRLDYVEGRISYYEKTAERTGSMRFKSRYEQYRRDSIVLRAIVMELERQALSPEMEKAVEAMRSAGVPEATIEQAVEDYREGRNG